MDEARALVSSASHVSLTPIALPSTRRLSSQFAPSLEALKSARRLAWVNLEGRVVNAEEASSAKAVGLSREEAVGWELFSPVERFLIVAVIGVAVAESKKNRIILKLTQSVELRDQVLNSMQQKLDNLCEQVNSINNQGGAKGNISSNKNEESVPNDAFGCDKIKFVDCGCWHCDQHENLFASLMGNSVVKLSKGDEMLHYKMPFIHDVEQDERRMSDLSDWASSVTSTAEIQMNSFAIDQDIFNLKRECEEKDGAIKELTTILQSTNMAGSKRIAELEDVIRRKNMMITRLKKDMVVLEQKVVQLTRLRRPSSTLSVSEHQQIPVMLDNIVYDMDSSTGPSSSDSDSSPANRQEAAAVKVQETPILHCVGSPSSSDSDFSPIKRREAPTIKIQDTPTTDTKIHNPLHTSGQTSAVNKKLPPKYTLSSLVNSTERHIKPRSVSPLREISTNPKSGRYSTLRPKHLSTSGDFKKIRRRTQDAVSKDAAPKKRWA